MDYRTVFKAIVSKAQELIGSVAITQANKLDGIKVTEQAGELIVSAEHELTSADIEELVQIYQDILGKGAYGLCRQAIKELVDEHGKDVLKTLELPQMILPNWLQADQFTQSM